MAMPNTWHQRRVADTASRPCWICFKPTSAVLHNPENKDFFYICLGHLKDKGFCTPVIDEADVAARRKKAEMDAEIERVKREYEEKKAKDKKKDKKKDKDGKKEKDEKEDKDKEKEEDKEEKPQPTEKSSGSSPSPSTNTPPAAADDAPRIFSLQKNFYQMRLDRLRKADIARRNAQRLQNPHVFPSVPSGDPHSHS